MKATSPTIPHHCSQHIRACPSQLSAARSLVTAHLRLWDCLQLADAATLIVTELAANAIQHTHDSCDFFGLAMSQDSTRILIAVTDSCRCQLPEPCSPDTEDVTGRGLMLVAAFASERGVRRSPEGKTVWASLRLARSCS